MKKLLLLTVLFIYFHFSSAQFSDSLNRFNDHGQKSGSWQERIADKFFYINALGSYVDNIKSGAWRYEVFYSDYNVVYNAHYYPTDSSVLFYASNIDSVGYQILVTPNSLTPISFKNNVRLVRWCIKLKDSYVCYEFSPMILSLKLDRKESLFEAIDYVTFWQVDKDVLKYILQLK